MNKRKAVQHPTIYAPCGESIRKAVEEINKTTRRYQEPKVVVIFQNIEQLKGLMEENKDTLTFNPEKNALVAVN